MAKKESEKITIVHSHPMRVPKSKKNPGGITIRDQHQRRLPGTYLSKNEIKQIFQDYDSKQLIYPSKGKLPQTNSNSYDDQIAVWTDYFNKRLSIIPPLHPDMVKALIASESDFRLDPKENKIATGIAQITDETWRILQDIRGEAKQFTFKEIRKVDLKDPNIAIPMCVRWLARKQETAAGKLGHTPTHEEVILEYKGLLKSKTSYQKSALGKYRKSYADLKK